MNRNLSDAQFKSLSTPSHQEADNYCTDCEFDHASTCESNGRPAIRRGEVQ